MGTVPLASFGWIVTLGDMSQTNRPRTIREALINGGSLSLGPGTVRLALPLNVRMEKNQVRGTVPTLPTAKISGSLGTVGWPSRGD